MRNAFVILLLGLLLLSGCQNASTSLPAGTAVPVEAVVVTLLPAPSVSASSVPLQLPSLTPDPTYTLTLPDTPPSPPA